MFGLKQIEGVWKNPGRPTIMIIGKSAGNYIIVVIYADEYTGQASPSMYDIEVEDDGYYFGGLSYRQKIEFEPKGWKLILSKYGSYYPG